MVKTKSTSPLVDYDSSVMASNIGKISMTPRAGDHSGDEDSDPGLILNPVKPARKRPRKTMDNPSKKPRRRGRLALMPTMNLDVLFHILSFLYPMDLLNLSRSSKDFRNLLLQPSSATAWKTARLQVEGLPDCPPDMSEPQYTNLAFYPHCHGCDRVVRTVLWPFRARYCSKCLVSNTVDQFGRGQQGQIPFMGFLLDRYLPSVTSRETGRYTPRCLKKAAEELLVEHSKTPQDEMSAFLHKKRTHANDVMRHAEQCQHWLQSVTTSRKHELEDLRSNRKDAIIARLTEAGYKPELDYIGISWLQKEEKALFTAKALTTKEWDRIRPKLITRIDPVRVRRLEEKVYGPRRKILMLEYEKYLQQPAPPGAAFDVMPHAVDVAEFGPFREIIMSPESTTITASSFVSTFQQLPDLVPSWRAKTDREFMDHIRFPKNQGDSGKKRGSDILQLATAVFIVRCDNGCRLFMYPEVLSWPVFFVRGIHLVDWMGIPRLRKEQLGCWTWSTSRRFPITISIFEGAATVIRAAGFDPKSTRREDMDRLDARFVCGVCPQRVIMKWDMAIFHSYRSHRSLHKEIKWRLVEGNELENVKNYPHKANYARDEDAIVHCALCQHHINDAEELWCTLDHLSTIHGIPSDKAEQGTHYIPDGPDQNPISVIATVLDSDANVG